MIDHLVLCKPLMHEVISCAHCGKFEHKAVASESPVNIVAFSHKWFVILFFTWFVILQLWHPLRHQQQRQIKIKGVEDSAGKVQVPPPHCPLSSPPPPPKKMKNEKSTFPGNSAYGIVGRYIKTAGKRGDHHYP